MTKEEHIQYWEDESERSWNDALVLANGKQFLMASFCLHLSIEKIIKANWVLYNSDNFPPRTHNLITILKETNLQTNNEVLILLEIINSWNIEGRYPDYKQQLYKVINQNYFNKYFNETEKIKLWLQKNLQDNKQ